MNEKQQIQSLEKKVRDLIRELQVSKLKNESLETLIKTAEKELHIQIKKKYGAKQSK